MPHFLFQGNYPPASLRAMMATPQDRAAAIAPMFEAAGGQLLHFFFALGESDWYALAELPDAMAAAAIAMAVGASGAVTGFKTTPLFTPAEGMAAMQAAGTLDFKQPLAT